MKFRQDCALFWTASVSQQSHKLDPRIRGDQEAFVVGPQKLLRLMPVCPIPEKVSLRTSGHSRLVNPVWLFVEQDHGVSPKSRSIGMHGLIGVACPHVLGIKAFVETIHELAVATGV